MALIRWEPARELQSVQSEINRLFNTLLDTPTATFRGTVAPRWVPAMDLVEGESEFVLRADLPGIKEEDVKIEVEDRVLTISGERKTEHEERREGYHRIERAFGAFSRSLTLPEGVDAQEVRASFDRSVLEIHVPKPAARKPQRIAINVGGTVDADTPAVGAGAEQVAGVA